MKHLFIPYELAVIAKEKGFNEPCIAFYDSFLLSNEPGIFTYCTLEPKKNDVFILGKVKRVCTAPIYQQLLDWFIVKHNIHPGYGSNHSGWYYEITKTNGTTIKNQFDEDYYKTHYEALNKAIEEAFKLFKGKETEG